MKIINKKISELIHPDYNPRQISKKQFEQLKKSLKNFSVVEPAVINIHKGRQNVIIGGNQRIRAAKEIGWIEFPCVEVELDEKKEKELNVRLNANTGTWDFDILANQFDLSELKEIGLDCSFFEKDNFKNKIEVDISVIVKFLVIEIDEWITHRNDIVKFLDGIKIKYELDE